MGETMREHSPIEILPFRAQRWADETFPGHTIADVYDKVCEEDNELQDAWIEAMSSTVDDGQWKSNIEKEAADGIILRMRLISKLGGHPWEVVLAKFAEVEARPKEYWEGKK
jgi:hypothetical protein